MKLSYAIYNTFSRRFSSFEINYSNERSISYYIICGYVKPLHLLCVWLRFSVELSDFLQYKPIEPGNAGRSTLGGMGSLYGGDRPKGL